MILPRSKFRPTRAFTVSFYKYYEKRGGEIGKGDWIITVFWTNLQFLIVTVSFLLISQNVVSQVFQNLID